MSSNEIITANNVILQQYSHFNNTFNLTSHSPKKISPSNIILEEVAMI